MACMTHNCRACKEEWFDNSSGGKCPKCGSTDVMHDWDEQDSYHKENGRWVENECEDCPEEEIEEED